MSRGAGLITVEEHRARVLAAAAPLPVESVPLAAAHGLCLAEPIAAREPVPPWRNSAMDGYAVRHADLAPGLPAELRVVADLPAGSGLDPALGPGEAARIMTGAPLPTDADTVVPIELTDRGTETVRIESDPGPGRHVREAGEDKAPGDPVAPAGAVATPEVISALASTGHGAVPARRRPRLAVIATGSELVEPGRPLERGRIPDSNSLLVAGLAREAGAEVAAALRVGDDAGELERAVAGCAAADLVVLTGGVSVGAHDPVKELFSGGDEVRFDRVSMQPGKPQAFGRLAAGPLLFGLPGNPVSAWVSFHVFVEPALRAMQGRSPVVPEPVPAVARSPWRARTERDQYLPAVIADGPEGRTVAPAAAGGSGSHLVGSLAGANGYAIVPAGAGRVAAGDVVATVRTGPEPAARPAPDQPATGGAPA